MDNNHDQSSDIVFNNETNNEIAQNEILETVLQTQPVSVINPENDNSVVLKKIAIFCAAGVLALSVFFIFAKGTDVCLAINCNDYSDSVATGADSSTSIGTDFVAYAGGAATLLVLTALASVPLLPAVAISTGVWFVIQMIH
ncbi:MAG: hypothetical protein ACRC2S_05070 [Waterburya sp.]